MIPANVVFTSSIQDKIQELIQETSPTRLGLLIDENTAENCLPLIKILEYDYSSMQIKSGERNKTLATCEKIWHWMTENDFDRKSLLINLGGGVICDMGGFCASTYKRGINFINIPTTLLSQVDASVGGKTGIDLGPLKNQIGVFQDAQSVVIDSIFLKTLPAREVTSGFAEMLKHALIEGKQAFEEIAPQKDWASAIKKSIAIKGKIVSQDPTETGLRKVLNLGHTIGHAIEGYFLEFKKAPIMHGEAVAAGILAENYLASKHLNFDEGERIVVEKKILEHFPVLDISSEDYVLIANLASQDKKNNSGAINSVLLKNIGEPVIDVEINKKDILEALAYYKQLSN